MTVRKYPIVKIAVPLVIIVLIIVLFNFSKTAPFLKNIFYQAFSPIQKIIISLRIEIDNGQKAISNFRYLKKNNEQLIKENEILFADIIRLRELSIENDTLRRALGLKINESFKLEEADIVGRDLNEKTVIIDAGTVNGLKKGMPVITAEKALIGKIDTVFEKYSVVRLIFSEDSAFDAKITDKNVKGIIKGGNGGLMSMELIPRNKDIKEGDVVLTTKEGGIYPDGIIIGRIASVSSNSLEPFLVVAVEPAFDIGLVKDIFIITNFYCQE